jgi:hypothetical protein
MSTVRELKELNRSGSVAGDDVAAAGIRQAEQNEAAKVLFGF